MSAVLATPKPFEFSVADGQFDLLLGRAALELRRELLDPARGVDEALLPGVGGMRVHRDIAQDDEIVHAIELLLAGRFHGGLGEEAFACSDVEEADVIENGVAFGLHGKEWFGSALTRFVTRLDFVDDVDLALATDDLAGRVTQFGGFDGGDNFHKKGQSIVRLHLCQRNSGPGLWSRAGFFFVRPQDVISVGCEPWSPPAPGPAHQR